jgi:excisionase family DNA binding protein
MGEGKLQGDEIMGYRELAAYLKVAEGTLRHYVMKGTIPFTKVGTHVRFLKAEIDQWLRERKRRPAGKRGTEAGTVKADGGMLPWAAASGDREQGA